MGRRGRGRPGIRPQWAPPQKPTLTRTIRFEGPLDLVTYDLAPETRRQLGQFADLTSDIQHVVIEMSGVTFAPYSVSRLSRTTS